MAETTLAKSVRSAAGRAFGILRNRRARKELESAQLAERVEVKLQEPPTPANTPVALIPELGWGSTPRYSTKTTGLGARMYSENAPLRGCVDLIRDAVCSGRLRVVDRDTQAEVPDHPATQLLRSGGTPQRYLGWTGKLLAQYWALDMYQVGNAFWELVPSVDGRQIAQVFRLDPRRVAYVPAADDDSFVAFWVYQVSGKWYPIDFERVIHFKHPDTEQPVFGAPPFWSCRKETDADNEIIDMFQVTAQNRAVLPIAVMPEDHDDTIGPGFEDMFRKATSSKRRGSALVLEGRVEIVKLAMNLSEAAVDTLVATTEGRICQAHRVPLILIGKSGTKGDPTRANYDGARREFWTSTAPAILGSFADTLTSGILLPGFDGAQAENLEYNFDLSAIPTIRELQAELAEKASGVFASGLAGRHVCQQMAGLPVHGPDVIYRSASVEDVIPADAEQEFVEPPMEM